MRIDRSSARFGWLFAKQLYIFLGICDGFHGAHRKQDPAAEFTPSLMIAFTSATWAPMGRSSGI